MSILMWGTGLQDSWSPVMVHISQFHDHVMMVVVLIVSIVLFCLTCLLYSSTFSRFMCSNETLEVIWTLLPAVILVLLSIPSLHTLYLSDEVVSPSLSIKVTGNQWYWSYQIDGFEELSFNSYILPLEETKLGDFRLLEVDNNLITPSLQEVRVIVTASDVIHSWTIPSLGVKVDAIPGRLNQLLFYSTRIGLVYGQCSEICGSLHSFMPICVEIIPSDKFLVWLKESVK